MRAATRLELFALAAAAVALPLLLCAVILCLEVVR